MKEYYYRVYGINIKSDIKIDELLQVDAFNHDDIVTVSRGIMPKEVQTLHKQGKFVALSSKQIYLYIPGIATYYINNGNKIIIEPYYKSDEKMVNIYFIGCVLGILMHQRGRVSIHGATIVKNNKAIIVAGECGVGKSTLSTQLRNKEYQFISDDVAAIKLNNKPYVMPGFPYQKLCEDIVEKLGYDKEKYNSFTSDSKIKYLIPVKEKFIDHSIELYAIFELTIGEVDEVTIEKVSGHNKLEKILNNLFCKNYINPCEAMNKEYFKQCIDIAKNINVYRIIRPYGKFTVDEQIKLIENEIS